MMSESKMPIEHLRVKLLKATINKIEDALDEGKDLQEYKLKTGLGFTGRLFIAQPNTNPPKWMEFVQDGIEIKIDQLLNRSNSAVLIIKVEKRFFAFPFGHGRFLLKDYCVESDFGIKTALNSLEHNSIRSIDSFTFEEQTVHHRAQASKESGLEVFGLDVGKDILQAVTGRPRFDIPFEGVAGKEDTIAISVRTDFKNLKQVCSNLYSIYKRNTYKKHFSWVDNIKRVSASDVIEELNSVLLSELKKKAPKVHLAPPEIIDWDILYDFSFTRAKTHSKPEMDIVDYLATTNLETLTIENLRSDKVFALNTEENEIKYSWPVYKCIVFECTHNKQTFILTNDAWFEIESKFSKKIRDRAASIPLSTLNLPCIKCRDGAETKLETEGVYNQRITDNSTKLALLDKKTVKCDSAGTSIEICDVFTQDKQFVHIKHRHGGSSAFSHLFFQGRVSAESLLSDEVYRKEIRAMLEEKASTWKSLIPIKRPDPSAYSIIFGFLGVPSDNLAQKLPFFSQLTLVRTFENLTSRGFKVEILGINKEE